MSATINHEVFVKYFNDAPLLSIPGFTHPVEDKCAPIHECKSLSTDTEWECRYLEDFFPQLNYRPSASKSSRKVKGGDGEAGQEFDDSSLDEESQMAIRAIMRSESFDYDVSGQSCMQGKKDTNDETQLIAATVSHIVSTAKKRGGILIFLSGVQEIRQCIERLRNVPNSRVLPLHANLTNDEQRRVFAPTSDWKIIVSTNVAEVWFAARLVKVAS